MNWGILVSWAALMGSIDWRVIVPLLLGSVWSVHLLLDSDNGF